MALQSLIIVLLRHIYALDRGRCVRARGFRGTGGLGFRVVLGIEFACDGGHVEVSRRIGHDAGDVALGPDLTSILGWWRGAS